MTDQKNRSFSLVVDRRVEKEKRDQFEEILHKLTDLASHRKGYLGTFIKRPQSNTDLYYQIILKYSSQESLEAWLNSEDRKQLIQQMDDLLTSPAEYQFITGLETWFTLPEQGPIIPPKKYKMAFVTWLGITPLLIVISYVFGPLVAHLSIVPRFLVLTPPIVFLMTYVIMPSLTKVFRSWLYPNN